VRLIGVGVCGSRNEVNWANEIELTETSLGSNGKQPGKSCCSSSVELVHSGSDVAC
jgi:hypothetical protein